MDAPPATVEENHRPGNGARGPGGRDQGRRREGARRQAAAEAEAAAPTAIVSDSPVVPGPVYGLRTWAVAGEPGHERLTGPQRATPWPTGGEFLEAECSVTPPHRPPGATCRCGLHAWHPSLRAARRVCGIRREVPGVLEASGAIEVHAEGFRAERGRPHALALLPNANRGLVERLAETYGIELIRLDRPRDLMRYCEERGLGLREDVVAELLGIDSLAAVRRERRRRGALTAALVAAVGLALGGVAVAVDPGAEHGKVLKGRTGEIRVP